MSKAEAFHFAIGDRTREAMLTTLGPIVRNYARSGFRKPRDVARLLNHANIRTADGVEWTARSASLLLTLLFTGKTERIITGAKPAPEVATGRAAKSAPKKQERRFEKSGTLAATTKPKPRQRRPSAVTGQGKSR
jgi:hypothetical protein